MTDTYDDIPPCNDSEKTSLLLPSFSKPRYGDRFMPTRTGNNWELTFPSTQLSLEDAIKSALKSENERSIPENSHDRTPCNKKRRYGESDDSVYSRLLKNEILEYDLGDMKNVEMNSRNITTPNRLNRKLFHYDSAERSGNKNEKMSAYSSSPLSQKSKEIIEAPSSGRNRISNEPYKILNANALRDDFYTDVLDWSCHGYLAVGLGFTVCMLRLGDSKSQPTQLISFDKNSIIPRLVTSVVYSNNGRLIGVATSQGTMEIWDVANQTRILKRWNHSTQVSSLSWSGDIVFSGSKDKSICVNDIRLKSASPIKRLRNHNKEICGLKWSELNGLLASGGNDNRLNIWDLRGNTYNTPLFTFDEHLAAIKGLDWNPNEHGILASGGGTADRKIRIWNTNLGACTKVVETGSQICNLVWSKHTQEFVTTHGCVNNAIHVWSYPNIRATSVLTRNSHTSRVLYLALSPNGEDIITGAGPPCETLRLWKVFPACTQNGYLKSAVRLFNIR